MVPQSSSMRFFRNIRLLCFSPDKRKLFEDAEKNNSPITIHNIQRSPSKMAKYSEEIKVYDNFHVTDTTLDFAIKKFDTEPSDFVKVSEIFDSKKPGDCVSIKCYVNAENRPVKPVSLKYQKDPINVKTVIANDDTGTIAVSLWGSLIDKIPTNNTYTISNCKVKLNYGAVEITTNSSTKIELAEDNIAPATLSKEICYEEVAFPAESIYFVKRKYFCPICKKYVEDVSQDAEMFMCATCRCERLSEKTENNVSVKALMSDGKIVYFAPTKVQEYFQTHLNKSLPKIDKEVTMQFLKNTTTLCLYDANKNCAELCFAILLLLFANICAGFFDF